MPLQLQRGVFTEYLEEKSVRFAKQIFSFLSILARPVLRDFFVQAVWYFAYGKKGSYVLCVFDFSIWMCVFSWDLQLVYSRKKP